MTPMHFDLAILAVLAFTAWRGAAKGLVWQLAWIAALILCFTVSGTASPPIARLIPIEAPLNRWIAMFVIYVASVFVTFWLARKINDWMEKRRFKDFDRHLGALFGFAKGVLISLTITFFLVTLSTSARDVVLNSKSGYAAALVMDRLHPVMSEEFHDALEPYIHQLDDAAGDSPLLHSHDKNDGVRGAAHKSDGKSSQLAGGSSSRKSGPSIESAARNPRRQDLLLKTAAVHSVLPADQAAIVADIETSLSGLPDAVSVAVLSDWYADLTKSQPDPDPQTGATSKLDTRIRRRLDAAGIPLDRLGSTLQNRIRDSQSR